MIYQVILLGKFAEVERRFWPFAHKSTKKDRKFTNCKKSKPFAQLFGWKTTRRGCTGMDVVITLSSTCLIWIDFISVHFSLIKNKINKKIKKNLKQNDY